MVIAIVRIDGIAGSVVKGNQRKRSISCWAWLVKSEFLVGIGTNCCSNYPAKTRLFFACRVSGHWVRSVSESARVNAFPRVHWVSTKRYALLPDHPSEPLLASSNVVNTTAVDSSSKREVWLQQLSTDSGAWLHPGRHFYRRDNGCIKQGHDLVCFWTTSRGICSGNQLHKAHTLYICNRHIWFTDIWLYYQIQSWNNPGLAILSPN